MSAVQHTPRQRDGIVAGFRAQMDLLAENERLKEALQSVDHSDTLDLIAENARLREAVEYAAGVFDGLYLHAKLRANDEGKAERNKRRRDKMRTALRGVA